MEPVLESPISTRSNFQKNRIESSDYLGFKVKKNLFENAIGRIDSQRPSFLKDQDRFNTSSLSVENKLDLPNEVIANNFQPSPTISNQDIVVRWKGFVTEINENIFICKLFDLDAKGTYEIGELPKAKVNRDDLNLLKVGATFYLSVGKFQNTKGEIRRKMILKFQRLVAWSTEEIDQATDRATYLAENISCDTLNGNK